MIETLKALARAVVPARWLPSARLRHRVITVGSGSVVSGPFEGMRYVTMSYGSVFFPKLLGTYELEVSSFFNRFCDRGFTEVVIAGAAEGYYAVGLARCPQVSRVVAFEPSEFARDSLARLAEINGVADKIERRGFADCSSLKHVLRNPGETFLLVDIEGAEAILLDPDVVPQLRRVTILVEVHEFAVAGIEAVLTSRFSATHEIARFDARPRTFADFPPALKGDLPRSFVGSAVQMMNEGRPPGMFWMLLTARDFAQSAAR